MEKKVIHSVIVYNGLFEHKVHYIHSPENILNCVTRALFFVKHEIIEEINDKKLTVLIRSELDYNNVISKTVLNASDDLILRFNNYK